MPETGRTGSGDGAEADSIVNAATAALDVTFPKAIVWFVYFSAQVRYNHLRFTRSKWEERLDTRRIVSELKAERNRLDKAITALDGASTTSAPVAVVKKAISTDGAQAPRKRHGLTAAGRKRLSMLMKKRWAERRKKAS